MRFSLLISILVFVGACSSAKKDNVTVPASTPPAKAVAPTTSTADKASAAVDSLKVTCANTLDTRVLDLREKNKGCELGYTKGGAEAIVATSVNGKAHCEATLTKIKEKLAGSGFTCK